MIRLASAPPVLLKSPDRLIWGGALAAGVVLGLLNLLGFTVELGALAVVVAIAAVGWRWPTGTAIFFAVFTPLNRFVLAALHVFIHSGAIDRYALLWKDALVAILVTRVLYDALFSRTAKKVIFLDFFVLAFILLAAIYIIYPGPERTDLFTRLQGFRTDASFLFAYFIGRAIHLERRHVRWMMLGLVPGSLVITGVAIFEFLAPSTAAHLISTYGLDTLETVRSRSISGVDLPRASALMGDLALSFYQMVLIALAAALYFQSSGRRRVLFGLFLVAMVATLVATLTRSAIVTGGVVIILTGVITRRFGQLIATTVAAAVIGGIAFIVAGARFDVVQRLATLGDASTLGHERALQRSLEIIQASPFGLGLGTAGTISQRQLGNLAITNENWYLQIGTEMGVLAAVLFLVIVAVVAWHSFAAYFRVHDVWLRALALGVGTGAIGFLILGNLLHAWENTILSMLFFMLAGIAVRAHRLEIAPDYGS